MIYAISDLHGIDPLPIPPDDAEVVLVVGDICPDYRPMKGRHWQGVDQTGHKQAAWLDTVWRNWLRDRDEDGVKVVGVWGNHDFVGEHPNLIPADLKWTLLQDSEITLDTKNGPLRVYGTPWVPGLPNWAFYASSGALGVRASLIPEGIDVLMTHGPPEGAGDLVPGGSAKQVSKYGNTHGMRVGEPSLNEAIERVKPKVTVCGHIHEDRGPHWVDGSWPLENVAAVDGAYEPYPDPFVNITPHVT